MSSGMSGFGAFYFARGDFEDFAIRKDNTATEFFWFPSPSLGRSAGTVGGYLADYYYPPANLNFGGDDNTQPVRDDPTLEGYKIDHMKRIAWSTRART